MVGLKTKRSARNAADDEGGILKRLHETMYSNASEQAECPPPTPFYPQAPRHSSGCIETSKAILSDARQYSVLLPATKRRRKSPYRSERGNKW